jgi:hypothetical protein
VFLFGHDWWSGAVIDMKGDILIKFYHGPGKRYMFRLQFHTGFVPLDKYVWTVLRRSFFASQPAHFFLFPFFFSWTQALCFQEGRHRQRAQGLLHSRAASHPLLLQAGAG